MIRSLRYIGFLWAALWPVSISGAAIVSVVEQEPNDTLATATDTGLTGLDTAFVPSGEVGNGPLGPGDRDIFSFEVPEGIKLPLSLTVAMDAAEEGFDGYVRVFDSTGYDLARHDDDSYPGLDPLLHTYLLEPGRYFVGVSHALNPAYYSIDATTGRPAGTGGYGLAIILSAGPSLAGSLEPGPIIVDSIPYSAHAQFIGDGPNLRMDVDAYVLEVDGPSLVTVTVTPTPSEALDPLVSMVVGGFESVSDGVDVAP